MLKKGLLITGVLLFAFGVLMTSLFWASAESSCPSSANQVLAIESETVDYYLPYPGILPDHFLYPVKVIRDKILLFLTTDPMRRAERLLHFADKRIEAARLLAESGKTALAVKTAVAAEDLLGQAINQEKPATGLAKAVAKHAEVLLKIEHNLAGAEAAQIRQLRQETEEWHSKLPI